MTNEIRIEISPEDLKRLNQKLNKMVANDTFAKALTAGASFLQGWIVENRLTGPRPTYLGVVSGRLRSSIAIFNLVSDKGQRVIRVGTNVEYAARHEYGFEGIESVRSHTRRKRQRVRLFGRTKTLDTRDVFVRPFTRIANTPAKPFLRPAAESESNKEKVATIVLDHLRRAFEQ